MSPRHAYLVLCVLGLVLPYTQFVPWVADHGLDAQRFVAELFANRVSAFFGLDVIVAAGALCVFVITDGRRERVPYLWAPIVATLAVGVSFGLPLFLYLRESRPRATV